ncbi:hypothetical protein BU25DRAFT_417912 [Macroventuria anomochaeta]|uniref:Uncharacterized protein n=1 Tax=Macroventuria anomochaeta TaxID=301207 RepID=A0ACB6SFQ7_9PLEO|nr:uncharacterized protein BU25DRAFT_417912 [Macroventuria anomochaeta]KAF2632168.1 hypothetical protein BU25DRAFT_417912 [Macroventuria anomochaeta]
MRSPRFKIEYRQSRTRPTNHPTHVHKLQRPASSQDQTPLHNSQTAPLANPMAPLNIIIVGGSLSGALLVNGLLSNNTSFTVYERDAADPKREGYQIQLGDSAITGFKACLPKDCMDLITRKFGQSSGSTATAPAIYNTR